MRPTLLFASMGVPGLGGSSTASYDLFRRVRDDGYDVHLVNLIEERHAAFVRHAFGSAAGNPLHLPNVHNCWLAGQAWDAQPGVAALVPLLDPDLIVAFGHQATRLLKREAAERRVVFVTGTCRQAQDYVNSGCARDAVSLARDIAQGRIVPRQVHADESRAVEECDLVVAHSPLTLAMVEWFYPGWAGKVYPHVVSFAEWICDGAHPWRDRGRQFPARDIDVAFVATNWERPEKNYPWVESLAARLRGATIHVIGDVPRDIPAVTHHGFLGSRESLYELLGRTRCVVSVSRIDAAPGVLFEAVVLGCNVIASRNCGTWELCHPDLLADPFSLDAFTDCVERALKRKYDDSLGVFLARRSYADLMATLDAFAHPFTPEAAGSD